MDIYEVIKKRKSVRNYRSNPISNEVLMRILDTARFAPSSRNSQEYKLIVVKDPGKIEEISKAAFGINFIKEAPIVIAGVSLNPNEVMENNVPSYPVNVAIILDHITLLAVAEDLGSCWITSFNQEEMKEILNVPEEYKIVALLTLGMPYDDAAVKTRKKLGEIVCFESFKDKD